MMQKQTQPGRKERFLAVDKPFELEPMLKSHGWFQLPPFYWSEAEKTMRWAVRRPQQPPALIDIAQVEGENPHQVSLAVRSSHRAGLTAPEQRLRRILNLDLDLKEFYRLCEQDPVLAPVPGKGLGRLMRCESLYEDLFKSICGTNIQWRQAVKNIRAIATAGDRVAGTDFYAFPAPEQILTAGEDFLKQTGRVGYRSAYLISLCRRFAEPDKEIENFQPHSMSYRELVRFFVSFDGIGPVTARYLTALYGRYDEMAIDSLVISFLSRHRFGGRTPSVAEIDTLYQPYGRWRYLASWMEFLLAQGWVPDPE